MRRREPHDFLAFVAGICVYFAFDKGKATTPNYLLLLAAAAAFVFWIKLEAKSIIDSQDPWRVIFTVLALVAVVVLFCCS